MAKKKSESTQDVATVTFGKVNVKPENIRNIQGPDFRSIYSNNVAFAMSIFDISFIFGEISGSEGETITVDQKVKITTVSPTIKAASGQKTMIDLAITNPYPYTINFSNTGYEHQVALEACLFKGTDLIGVQRAGEDFHQLALKPAQSTHYRFIFAAPMQKGKYTMLFSLITDPFAGSKNSRIISLTIE